jgi:hypothetical protein
MPRAYDWDIPGHAGEDDRGNKHDHEDNPGVMLTLPYFGIIAVPVLQKLRRASGMR